MTAPIRIQRKRTKGWRMPPGAIYVGRPTIWGNPVRMDGWQGALQAVMMFGSRGDKIGRADAAVKAYRLIIGATKTVIEKDTRAPFQREAYTLRCIHEIPSIKRIRAELRGLDLACWCPLTCPDGSRFPCHADVLLELANEPREGGA